MFPSTGHHSWVTFVKRFLIYGWRAGERHSLGRIAEHSRCAVDDLATPVKETAMALMRLHPRQIVIEVAMKLSKGKCKMKKKLCEQRSAPDSSNCWSMLTSCATGWKRDRHIGGRFQWHADHQESGDRLRVSWARARGVQPFPIRSGHIRTATSWEQRWRCTCNR